MRCSSALEYNPYSTICSTLVVAITISIHRCRCCSCIIVDTSLVCQSQCICKVLEWVLRRAVAFFVHCIPCRLPLQLCCVRCPIIEHVVIPIRIGIQIDIKQYSLNRNVFCSNQIRPRCLRWVLPILRLI